jgi:hypothetical protein
MQVGKLCDVTKAPYNAVNGSNGTDALQVSEHTLMALITLCLLRPLMQGELCH